LNFRLSTVTIHREAEVSSTSSAWHAAATNTTKSENGEAFVVIVLFQDCTACIDGILVLIVIVESMKRVRRSLISVGSGVINTNDHRHLPAGAQDLDETWSLNLGELAEHDSTSWPTIVR
jgi:hypothetical protein